MAVQKSRKTRSKRGMRRSHDHLSLPTLTLNPQTQEVHLRHFASATGVYRGRKLQK